MVPLHPIRTATPVPTIRHSLPCSVISTTSDTAKLRIYFLQQWFNLSDLAVEEALYDSQAMRRVVGIDLGREPVARMPPPSMIRMRITSDRSQDYGANG